MPAPTILHDVSHCQQQHDGDCLAACAAMILDALAQPIEYAALLRLLRIRAWSSRLKRQAADCAWPRRHVQRDRFVGPGSVAQTGALCHFVCTNG